MVKYRNYYFFILVILLFSLPACSVTDKLETWDQKAGELFFSGSSSQEVTLKQEPEVKPYDQATDWRDLSPGQKTAIDAWLKENGYNRYGDSRGILYTGGTPLFNEETGETLDRYEYILERHPDIFDNMK